MTHSEEAHNFYIVQVQSYYQSVKTRRWRNPPQIKCGRTETYWRAEPGGREAMGRVLSTGVAPCYPREGRLGGGRSRRGRRGAGPGAAAAGAAARGAAAAPCARAAPGGTERSASRQRTPRCAAAPAPTVIVVTPPQRAPPETRSHAHSGARPHGPRGPSGLHCGSSDLDSRLDTVDSQAGKALPRGCVRGGGGRGDRISLFPDFVQLFRHGINSALHIKIKTVQSLNKRRGPVACTGCI